MAEVHWLDKHIAEQAAHYGMTVEAHASLMSDVADCGEAIEAGLIEEPKAAAE